MIPATRVITIASTVLAAGVESFLASYYHPNIFWLSVAGLLVMAAVGSRWRSVALPAVMSALYVTPAILLVTIGARGYEFDVIWILPLLGVILSDRKGLLAWSLPDRWQWPLVTWSVLVAISWPIIFLREANLAPWILLNDARVSNTSIGTGPSLVDQNVAYFALLHNVGILWLDALFRWYRDDQQRFRREVLGGLLVASAIAGVVAVYQGFVDLGFLNRGFWEYMIRASGTLGDANKLGAVAAFWTVGAIVYARSMKSPWSIGITIGGLMVGIAAAWLSGSRTGLASVMISASIAAIEALRWLKLDVRKLALAAAGVVVIGGVMILALQGASTHTIVQRGTLGYLPYFGDRGIANSANELLWERFGYGPAAIQMVKEHPVDGVGVGTYHALSYDFGRAAGRIIPAQDNAQAWWRHNFAELGIVGSIPLLVWLIVFGGALWSPGAARDPLSAGILRGVLIAFFIASLFGLPSQSMAITVTFWVFVFWFVVERGSIAAGTSTRWSRAFVATAVVLIALHTGMTVVHAFGDLRPQNRAQRFNWYYRYGWVQPDDVEADPGGNPIGRRWTTEKSLAVIPVKGKMLKFVAWVDHPDADQKPVHTQVWADGALVYEGDLRRTPLFLDIPATPGRTHMVLETSIDRVWRPSDFGRRDQRALGLSIRDWRWE